MPKHKETPHSSEYNVLLSVLMQLLHKITVQQGSLDRQTVVVLIDRYEAHSDFQFSF